MRLQEVTSVFKALIEKEENHLVFLFFLVSLIICIFVIQSSDMRYLPFIWFFIFYASVGALAQKKAGNDVNTLYFTFTGAYQLPKGDLVNRFGSTPNIGFYTDFVSGKSSYIFGLDASFSFGEKVKEDVGALFRTPEGVLIGTDQTATQLFLKERVFTYGIHFGKLFALNKKKNPRSGIRATIGVGRIRHWIKITDEFNSANQFKDAYAKGYDRLTAGMTVTPFLGYQYTSLNRYLNFVAGVEYVAGFTRSQRSWDFDLFKKEEAKRFDGILGFRIGFSLPLFIGDSERDIEY